MSDFEWAAPVADVLTLFGASAYSVRAVGTGRRAATRVTLACVAGTATTFVIIRTVIPAVSRLVAHKPASFLAIVAIALISFIAGTLVTCSILRKQFDLGAKFVLVATICRVAVFYATAAVLGVK